jgi:hypothetical protein
LLKDQNISKGVTHIGFMDEWDKQEVLLAFRPRGRAVQLRASAKGGAQMYLKRHPWTDRMRTSRVDHEQKALQQGHIGVNSILRDWIKGQVTAIECGILSFEAVFMPYMLAVDGRRSNVSRMVICCRNRMHRR